VKIRPGDTCRRWTRNIEIPLPRIASTTPTTDNIRSEKATINTGIANGQWYFIFWIVGVTWIGTTLARAAFIGPRTPFVPTTAEAALSVKIKFGMRATVSAD
jgi:hypothetical protein